MTLGELADVGSPYPSPVVIVVGDVVDLAPRANQDADVAIPAV